MKKLEFIKVENDNLKAIIDDFSSIRHTFNNYYGIDLNGVECIVEADNLFLIKRFIGYNRLYMIANDSSVVIEVLRMIPSNTVINIPSRTEPFVWDALFKDSRIEPLAKYHRLNYTNYRKGNNKNLEYANESDTHIIIGQLNDFFSPLTGHLPSTDELTKMINNKTIIVNRDEQNQISGAISCQIIGKKAELTFWYDYADNGLSLLYNVFFVCHEKEVRIITFWVNDENANTIGIHEMLGAKKDGLTDYIYIKK